LHSPYTLDYASSFAAAQWSAALLLTALLLFWRGPSAARGVMLAAIWLAVASPWIAPTLTALGYHPEPNTFSLMLAASALVATVGCVFAGRPLLAVVALLGEAPLWLVTGFVKESDAELSALHLAWVGLLMGLLARSDWPRSSEARRPEPEESYVGHDVALFSVATALAALVCVLVLRRRDGGADEWGYTFQAAVFAKGHAYAAATRCASYLDSFYVFESEGRLFSQYTPGWPLFLAPFVWLRAVWLSGPVSLGLMAVGIARLSRSAMRGYGRWDAPPSSAVVRSAGTCGGVLAALGTSILINGASRYPHVFVVGTYAWTIEAAMMLATPGLSPRRQHVWGAVLATAAVFGVAARPADGAFLGGGVALVLLYFLARRRIGWRGLMTGTLVLGGWTLLMLVILRLQLGKWFATGYSLNDVIRPWNVVKYSIPKPSEWRAGLPLATGSYCWWPCSLPLGLAGLAMLRGRALAIASAIALGCVPYLAFTTYLDFGRTYDWGYGPRYQMPLLVPMAVGSAVALAPMMVAGARRLGQGSALSRGGPLALAAFAVVGAWLRIVPLEWPTMSDHAHRHASLTRAVEEAHLTNAIVLAAPYTTGFNELDLTTNLPIDLYPDQDVIYAIDKSKPAEAVACLRNAFPARSLWLASGVDPVILNLAP
jgi:hypothetical protein